MSKKVLNITVISIFAILAVGFVVLRFVNSGAESGNLFTVSEIKNDDSTYKYVAEKCAAGFFSSDSENCVNLREARP